MACILMKRGQFDFVWIFAILAGGAILVLAIYGAMQTGDTLRYEGDTKNALSISILVDPLQAGSADGSFGKILFQQETRIRNVCWVDPGFGKNDISVATKSGVGKEWKDFGEKTYVYNKDIFSKEKSEGSDYYVFSKSFDFPYKVSDLIFLMDGTYCFLGDVPDSVVDEVTGLGIENILFENCSSLDERVCFGGGSDCDMIVYGLCSGGCDSPYDHGKVSKEGVEIHYVGNLMWGAIFSDKDVYECNVGRLMYRTKKIAEIFSGKVDLMDARNCESNMKVDLVFWTGTVGDASSENLVYLKGVADDMDRKNNLESCGVW